MVCSKCSAHLPADAEVCLKCGELRPSGAQEANHTTSLPHGSPNRTYAALLYRAPCYQVIAGTAPIFAPLADLTGPQEADRVGDATSIPVAVSTTALQMALPALLADRLTVAVYDRNADGPPRCLACGSIGGHVTRGTDGQATNVFFGLSEADGSGHAGVGWLAPSPDGTMATVFVAPLHPHEFADARAWEGRLSSPLANRQGAAVYCAKCGKQLPADAAFCSKCGRPQGAARMGTDPAWTPNADTPPTSSIPRPSRFRRLTDAVGSVGGVLLAVIVSIVSLEVAAAVAFWTWRTFGPLSVIVTFQLWPLVPFWYAWRWIIGHLTGWGWPV